MAEQSFESVTPIAKNRRAGLAGAFVKARAGGGRRRSRLERRLDQAAGTPVPARKPGAPVRRGKQIFCVLD